ncbi:MAG TPA: efflux transporter outer membrane subunit [Gammaproteobacteria bacterium]
MRRMGYVALAVALACAGCAVGPDYRAPEPAPAAVAPFAGADVDAFRQDAPADDWWRLYDDPVLDAAIGEALDANTDLRRAAANLARASALLAEARGGRLPTTTFGAGATSGRQNVVQQGFAFEDTIYDVGLDVSYQVDLFGRVRRAVQAARADAEAVEAVYHTVQITVAAETARAYVAACAARLELEAAERSLALQRETEALTQRLYAAGRGTALDVARASAAAERTRATIPTLEAAHRSALYRLAVLMGRAPTDFPPEAAECRTPPTLDAPIAVGDGAALLARRPDIREAERRLAAATARIGVATADLYPSVSLAGSTGAVALAASDLDSGDASRWSFGPLVRFSFPNRTIVRARLAQAEADADAALAAFDGAWLNALREVESALVDYSKELERRDALSAARGHAADAARLARARFDAGQVSFLDVLQADLALAEAEAALARSVAQTAQLEVELFLALGGGWGER